MSKIIIIDYSYSGNTKKVADALAKELSERSSINRYSLNVVIPESKYYIVKLLKAMLKGKIEVKMDVPVNLLEYDLICFGFPVRAMGIPPAFRYYLDKVPRLEGKKVIVFITHQTEVGKVLALKEIEKILVRLGLTSIIKFSINDKLVGNLSVLNDNLKDLVENIVC